MTKIVRDESVSIEVRVSALNKHTNCHLLTDIALNTYTYVAIGAPTSEDSIIEIVAAKLLIKNKR